MAGTRIEIILIMGLMAFAVRALPQILFTEHQFPEAWDRFLRYLSYALICSIISITLFMADARFDSHAAPHRAAGLIAAIAVARVTKSAVTGMIVGAILVSLLSSMR